MQSLNSLPQAQSCLNQSQLQKFGHHIHLGRSEDQGRFCRLYCLGSSIGNCSSIEAPQNGQNRKERDSAHGEPPDDITRLSRLLQPPQRPTKIRAMTAQATVVAPAIQSEFATRKIGNLTKCANERQ